ncbi:MAG TPA: DoxX family protein [Vicinamibacterales bacterium]|jgi:putative oxidoreductase
MDYGLLFGRVVLGGLMAAHGSQKLFGWFGGYGLAGTAGFFDAIGFRPGRLFALSASLGEVVSGILVALGLFGPIGPALMLTVMIVAAISVHWQHGLFAASNGIEVPLLYAAGAAALALTGPGRFSLDALFGFSGIWSAQSDLIVLAIAIIAATATLAMRRTVAGTTA